MALSDQRKEYLYEYQRAKLKRVSLDVTREKYGEIKAVADAAGEPINGYIKGAIDMRINQERPASPAASSEQNIDYKLF